MQYYCDICRKDITKEEFLYSIDKFDKPLCREHQELFRTINSGKTTEQNIVEPKKEITQEESQQINLKEETEKIPDELPTKTSIIGGFLKKGAVVIGKGIVKGFKKIADSSAQAIQKRRWKDDILRRMNKQQIVRLCYEKRIATTTNYMKELPMKDDDLTPSFETRTRKSTFEEMVSRIKNNVDLNDIISFAKRNHINIRDILSDIERKKAEWEVKKINETIKEKGSTTLLEVEKAIREFKLYKRYDSEEGYHYNLASFLQTRFPDTKVEVTRGSTRPDIVVEGIAIEVKGPTWDIDLTTIADKCLRYPQYFHHGFICVLFDVHVYPQRYEEWLRGMKNKNPDVIVIRKA